MAVYNYNASDSTHIDQNLTDFEGSQDANLFSIYIPTNTVYNPATNSTTVTYSYMLHARGNNFSQYSCTTYAQYKTNGAASYTKSYNPATTIQYYAATQNRYYWMGNNDGTPPISFAASPYTIPTTGTVTSPAASAWSFTVNHDASGLAPATTIQAYMDSNTNTTYVPVGTTITATLTTNLNSATTNLNYVAPSFTSGIGIKSLNRRSGNPSIIDIVFSSGSYINTNVNNAVYYEYGYSFDGVNWTNSSLQTLASGASGGLPEFTMSPSVTATQSYSVYTRIRAYASTAMTAVLAVTQASSITSAGIPSAATGLSASESGTQSRTVTIYWTPGADGGSALTSQTLEWSTGTSDANFSAGYVGGVILNGTATSYTITPSSAPTAGTSVLLPSTKYTYRITETNAVGSNGTTVTSGSPGFETRASSPFISPSSNTAPNTRSSTKVWNGSAMVQANVMVYDGTTPYNVSGWKYLK